MGPGGFCSQPPPSSPHCLSPALRAQFSLVIALTLLVGLTSATFYPLTLTFALPTIPLLYTFLSHLPVRTHSGWGGEHRTFALGWYRNHLCQIGCSGIRRSSRLDDDLYLLRIPETRMPPKKSGKHRATQDFCIARQVCQCCCWRATRRKGSTGGAPEYSSALFAAGRSFLPCALVRRLRVSKSVVALPYLRSGNTVLLGSQSSCFQLHS